MQITHHTFNTKPKVTLPIIVFKGKKKGPTAFISGGMHGDELNGMILVKKFIEHFKANDLEQKMAGKIIVMPILNTTGFLAGRRRAVPDSKDMNRVFPGKSNGSFSQKFAYELFEKFISKADFGIDCHDAGKNSSITPHPRVSKCEEAEGTCMIQNLGRLFGTEIILQRAGRDGMLALAAQKAFNKPLVTIETGGSNRILEDFMPQGIEGIKNILRFYQMLPGKAEIPKKQFILKSRFGVKAKRAGIISLEKKLGQFVHAGDKIGTIYHPQDFEEQPLTSPMCGVLFSLHEQQFVKEDEIIYSILEKQKCHVNRTTTGKFTEMDNAITQPIIM